MNKNTIFMGNFCFVAEKAHLMTRWDNCLYEKNKGSQRRKLVLNNRVFPKTLWKHKGLFTFSTGFSTFLVESQVESVKNC